MKTTLKPAPAAARALLLKLNALVERGVNGERAAAEHKRRRLLARYDFAAPPAGVKDLFAGTFRPASVAVPVAAIPEPDIANAVKWSFETTAGIDCQFRGAEVWAAADRRTADRMARIAALVAGQFRALWQQYTRAGGQPVDRSHFMLGLYEGMMNEARQGQALPARPRSARLARAHRRAVAHAPGLNLHPYSIATGLGRNIRFEVPLTETAAQLDRTLKGEIAA